MIKLLPALNLKNVKVKENIQLKEDDLKISSSEKLPGIAALGVFYVPPFGLFFLGGQVTMCQNAAKPPNPMTRNFEIF
jgi:hypothetical protein